MFQTLKGSLQTGTWKACLRRSFSFKPSKDRYKPFYFMSERDAVILFQTLKGSLQTLDALAEYDRTGVRFKPSKDRYKRRSSPRAPAPIPTRFQTLKGSLQTLGPGAVEHRKMTVSNPQRIATNDGA